MRILLTGAAGYLGGVLARRLLAEEDVEILTGVDLASPSWMERDTRMRFLRLDVRDPALHSVVPGHDVVMHTAFVVLWRHAMPAATRDDINRNGTVNVARAARDAGVRRFVYASSDAAYDQAAIRGRTGVTEDFPLGSGDSPSFYCNAKAEAERRLRDLAEGCDMVLTCFRPGYIVGPGAVETAQALRKGAVGFCGHDPRVQYVHENDVADAFLLAARRDLPGAYNLDPDDFLRWSEAHALLGRRRLPRLPVALIRAYQGFEWRFLQGTTHPSWIDVLLADFTLSNARLRAAGWAPAYRSAEALLSAF